MIFSYTTISTLNNKRPYQLENWCLQFPEVSLIIKQIWSDKLIGNPSFILSTKITKCRHSLQKWYMSHEKFNGIDWKRISTTIDQHEHVEDIFQAQTYLSTTYSLMNQASLCFSYWKQRMKDKWLLAEGTSTKICYSMVRVQRKHNSILASQDITGNWISEPQEMMTLVVDFFQKIYTPDH